MHSSFIHKWISILYRLNQSYVNNCFKQYEIGSGHFVYLLVLYNQDGLTQDAISKQIYVDKANTTRALTKLESLGYIRRECNLDDKRSYFIYLTQKGKNLETEIKQKLKKWELLITEGMTEAEKIYVYDLLQKMAEKAVSVKEEEFYL